MKRLDLSDQEREIHDSIARRTWKTMLEGVFVGGVYSLGVVSLLYVESMNLG